jgi:hypothetical protein
MSLLKNFINPWGLDTGVLDTGVLDTDVLSINADSQLKNRPAWKLVYKGYPKDVSGTDDKPTDQVFKEILGDKYDPKIFTNACATRLSLGLIAANYTVRTDYRIQIGQYEGKGFITSAIKMKNWLLTKKEFETPDFKINTDEKTRGKITLKYLQSKIGSKNGIYIVIPYPGCFDSATGHVTLWIGAKKDVVGGHNYVECAGDIYFWQLP